MIDDIIARYITDHGGFPHVHRSAPQPWDERVLHVTDIGACPRAVALRLSGAPAEPLTAGEQRMFWIANMLHELVYHALEHCSLLERCEVPVALPDGWSGTADAIVPVYADGTSGRHVVDVKTSHPNSIRYARRLPHDHHVWQVATYTHMLGIERSPEIYYIPMGGSGKTEEVVVREYPSREQVEEKMRTLEAVRDMLPDLPDILPGYIDTRNTRTYFREDGAPVLVYEIVLRASDWRCQYCRYECPGRGRSGYSLLARVRSSPEDGTEVKMTPAGRMMSDSVEEFALQYNDTVLAKEGGEDGKQHLPE